VLDDRYTGQHDPDMPPDTGVQRGWNNHASPGDSLQ
jgi:hypothetical protein